MVSQKLDELCQYIEALAFTENTLNNSDECIATFAGYECTRPLGHDGWHIALGGKVCTIWAQGTKEARNVES